MRVLALSDLHLGFFKKPHKIVYKILKTAKDNSIDLIVIAGDTIQGTMADKEELQAAVKLLTLPDVLFVFGNHDIWQECPEEGYTWSWGAKSSDPLELPPVNYLNTLKTLPNVENNILEKNLTSDDSTFKVLKDCVVVGTMGFPDFSHPYYIDSQTYYDKNPVTNDKFHIDLSKGFKVHSELMISMFEKRLEKCLENNPEKLPVVVVSHYPCFESQTIMKSDYSSPYYFCNNLGIAVRKESFKHPDINFLAICGHSHQYNRETLFNADDNIYSFGIVTNYQKIKGNIFQVDKLGITHQKTIKIT